MLQKTTWAGILTIVSSICFAVSTKDMNAAAAGIASGLGLVFAGDSKPT
jgi:hypothetical protein